MLRFRTPTLLLLISFTSTLIPARYQTAFAEGGSSGRGGGTITELQIKNMLSLLADYLSSVEGKVNFKEVNDYDLTHPNETIEKLAMQIDPVLVHEKVFFNGVERDCVSESPKSFKCNIDRMPSLPASDATSEFKSVYYLFVYQLVFHEVLVQTGLEDQLNDIGPFGQVPSNYPISSRLSVKVVNQWVPGNTAPECSACAGMDANLLKMPAFEALEAFSLKLKMKRDLLITNSWIPLSSDTEATTCFVRQSEIVKSAMGKTLSLANPDGSARSIVLNSSTVQFNHNDDQRPFSNSLLIQTGLPAISTIECSQRIEAGANLSVEQLIEALSPYFEIMPEISPVKI